MANTTFIGDLGKVLTGSDANPLEGVVAAGACWLDQRSQDKQAALDRKAAQNTAALAAQTSQANAKTAVYIGGAIAALVAVIVIFKRKG